MDDIKPFSTIATPEEMDEFKKVMDDYRLELLKKQIPKEFLKFVINPKIMITPPEYVPLLFDDEDNKPTVFDYPRVITATMKPFPCANCGADEVEGMGWICSSGKHHEERSVSDAPI